VPRQRRGDTPSRGSPHRERASLRDGTRGVVLKGPSRTGNGRGPHRGQECNFASARGWGVVCSKSGPSECRRKLVGNLPWSIPTVVVYRQTGAQAMNLMVTPDTDKVFIQVRPPCGRSTYVLRLIVLLWIELCRVELCMICPLGDLCPSLYILKGQSYKQSILFGTISCSLAVHVDQHRTPHVFILWAEPPLMVRPMSTHEGIGIYTPTVNELESCS